MYKIKNIELGSSYISEGFRKNIPVSKNPSDTVLLVILDFIKNREGGIIVLEILDSPR